MNLFYASLAARLGVPSVAAATPRAHLLGGGDARLADVLALLADDWQTVPTPDEIAGFASAADLFACAFRAFAAALLGVPTAQITLHTGMGDLPQWDSVNHLRLLMEAEIRFGVRFELERIPSIKTLNDMLAIASGA